MWKIADRLPRVVGANWIVKSSSSPGWIVVGVGGVGKIVNDGSPESLLIPEMWRSLVPTLKTCTIRVARWPTPTLPKPRSVFTASTGPVGAFSSKELRP